MMSRRPGRYRMFLTLLLAVVLPAAALIAFSLWSLHSIHRDRAVEAAMQRDFSRVLEIAEKRLNEKARRMVEEARNNFPCPADSPDETGQKLSELLKQRPQFAHAFLYWPHKELIVRSQPDRKEDQDFHEESMRLASSLEWLTESKIKTLVREFREREKRKEEIEIRLREMQEKEKNDKDLNDKELEEVKQEPVEEPLIFNAFQPSETNRTYYESYALMTLPQCEGGLSFGGIAFDAGYLREKFFPRMLDGILSEEQAGKSGHPVMMLHGRGHNSVVAASKGWDGGMPESERKLEEGVSAFPSLILSIKLRGTTIEALSRQFEDTNFLIIGAISLFLLLGTWQMYRNVSREVALARLKSDFVANVSHELRTPLSLIRLYAETLEMGRLTNPDKPQQYYRIIREESERLTALINNILDFSRIEAGRKEYDFRETDLARLVRETLDAYRYQIEQNGFTFQEQIEDNLPPVCVDREAIARSLLNLVNNAVKYSPQEKFLSVKLFRSGNEIKLQVADHGMGIPIKEQSKIFEKFYRVGDPLVHNTKGSGLGLSLVRHIVQAHGGEVFVESAPGKGSTFTIALPLAPGGMPA
jgi:signal transduction histidine kinase